jgi:hypothetical protein
VGGAVSYDVWITNVSTGQSPQLLTTSATNSFTPAGDLGIGLYEVWVRAVMPGNVRYAWSLPRRFQVETAVTVNPPAARFQTYRPTITWQALPGAVRYDVWVNNVSTGQSQVVRDLNVVGTSWTPASDLPISAYRIWVRGIDASGRFGTWSPLANFQVAVPPAPLSPLTSTFDRTPTFSWTPVTGAVSYIFMLRNTGTGVTTHYVTGLSSPAYTPDTNLPDGSYRWWAIAVGAASLAGDWTPATDVYIGGWAQFTSAGGTLSTTPTFTWTAVGDAVRYELQVNRIDVPQFNVIRVSDLTTNSYAVTTPFVPGGTYRAWVRAISTTGEVGLWSITLNFTVADAEPASQAPDAILTIEELEVLLAELLPGRPALPVSTNTGLVASNHRQPSTGSPDENGRSGSQRAFRTAAIAHARSQPGVSTNAGHSPTLSPDDMIQAIVDQLLVEGFVREPA